MTSGLIRLNTVQLASELGVLPSTIGPDAYPVGPGTPKGAAGWELSVEKRVKAKADPGRYQDQETRGHLPVPWYRRRLSRQVSRQHGKDR